MKPEPRRGRCASVTCISGDRRVTKIRELERRIAELRARLPKHSAPTAMMVELDELEDALRRLRDGLGYADECR